MTTITEYRIRDLDGATIITDDTDLADACARSGCRVSATTHGCGVGR